MESLAAIALAGNVLQFARFAYDLINNVHKIHSSELDSSEDEQHIENIQQRLLAFSNQLRSVSQSSNEQSGNSINPSHVSLTQLVKSCSDNCEKLLDITRKLQVKSDTKRRWWRSFQKAMYDVWKEDEIKRLEDRIRLTHTEIVMGLCDISAKNAEDSNAQLQRLIQQLIHDTSSDRAERIQKFDHLQRSLASVEEHIKFISGEIIKPDKSGIVRSFEETEVNILTTYLSNLSLKERQYAKEEAILTSLNYEQRPMRHESIPEAHKETFSWVLSKNASTENGTTHHFVEWLERGEGFYWVSGKPGSGKSTLMKFVAGHRQLPEYLFPWSSSCRVVSAAHFFWSAGTPIQRSQEGLLRSLLYHILVQLPELALNICSEKLRDTEPRTWSLKELRHAFGRLKTTKNMRVKFCFLIDGLDEFEGDPVDICNVLTDLCVPKYIKICIASRPWNVFESYFGRDATKRLKIHDLTQSDIQNYVNSELNDNSGWFDASADPEELLSLIHEITSRAQGVFLWVFLVVRMLREGIMNGDSLVDLWSRLDSIPTDLERFFKHILESVESFYHETQCNMLQIALAAIEPLPTEIYSFHDMEYTDENYALSQELRVFTPEELAKFTAPTARRLNARCKGLLEIHVGTVVFLHRTVRDFLHTQEMSLFLTSKTQHSFNPALSLLRAYVAFFKTADFSQSNPNTLNKVNLLFSTVLGHTLDYARLAEKRDLRCQTLCAYLLDDLDLSIQTMFSIQPTRLTFTDTEKSKFTVPTKFLFRQALIEKDVKNYISAQLTRDPEYCNDIVRNPLLPALEVYLADNTLDLIFCDSKLEVKRRLPQSTKLLESLLKAGESPNCRIEVSWAGATTPWIEFMAFMSSWHEINGWKRPATENITKCFLHALDLGVFSLLLDHGADPNARIPYWKRDREIKQSRVKDVMGIFNISPTICVAWIILGLTVSGLWKHGDKYIQDLKAMIKAGADFRELSRSEDLETSSVTESSPHIQDTGFSRPYERKPKRRKGEIPAPYSRWNYFCYHLGRSSIVAEKIFHARIVTELATADTKSILPWKDLEPVLERYFPEDLRNTIYRAREKILVSRP